MGQTKFNPKSQINIVMLRNGKELVVLEDEIVEDKNDEEWFIKFR